MSKLTYELSVVKKINLNGRQFNIFYDLPALRVVNLQENKNLTLDKRHFLKLLQTMEAQKEIELQNSGLTTADFQIDLGWIENCGCEMQWLFRAPNYFSKYFVALCGDYYDFDDDDEYAWVSLKIQLHQNKTKQEQPQNHSVLT